MKSLTHYIYLAGGISLAIVLLMGSLSIFSVEQLEKTHSHLLQTIVPERKILGDFQSSVYVLVNNAHAFEQTEQYQYLQEARAELVAARELLPQVAKFTQQIEHDGFAADRQAEREQLIADATAQLDRLEQAVEQGSSRESGLALQRLDLIASDVRVLERASNAFLQAATTDVVAQINQSLQRVRSTMVITVIIFVFVGIGFLVLVRDGIVRSLQELLAGVEAAKHGNLQHTVAVRSGHEVGRLQAGFNAMVSSLLQQQQAVQQHTAALEHANQQQRQMLDTIQALSVPVLPLLDGVLVLPVMGSVDDDRLQTMKKSLLHAVHAQHARVAILDITGLAVLDGAILARLLEIVRAVELLGARVLLAGVSAEVAQTIVENQLYVADLRSFSTLRDALESVLTNDMKFA